eukprot:312314-Karenia_brevis.AAC.1
MDVGPPACRVRAIGLNGRHCRRPFWSPPRRTTKASSIHDISPVRLKWCKGGRQWKIHAESPLGQ